MQEAYGHNLNRIVLGVLIRLRLIKYFTKKKIPRSTANASAPHCWNKKNEPFFLRNDLFSENLSQAPVTAAAPSRFSHTALRNALLFWLGWLRSKFQICNRSASVWDYQVPFGGSGALL